MDSVDISLDELLTWLGGLNQPALWWQLGVLLLSALLAWLVHHRLSRLVASRPEELTGLKRLTLRSVQRILWPLSMLLGVLAGRAGLTHLGHASPVLGFAVPLLLSLAAIRFVVYVLRKGFAPSPLLKAWENLVSTAVWSIVALHLLGWLPAVTQALDGLAFQLGAARVSLLAVIKLVLLVALLLTLALWLSGLVERRVRASAHLGLGAQEGLAKFTKFFLLTLAVLLSLNAVGIDLTALTVFGGALGVGLGFGLQRIASNFISGFILIMDRSIRPGDVISIGERFGWVQELRARYIVVRNRDGVETLIPNENLITSEVINWSYSDRNVRIRIPVQISYADDPEQAMALMVEAACEHTRVLQDPAPVCRLMNFGDNGINLELRVWINDPEEGVGNIKSDLNLAVWRAFKAAAITIPFPQRDLYVKQWPREKTPS